MEGLTYVSSKRLLSAANSETRVNSRPAAVSHISQSTAATATAVPAHAPIPIPSVPIPPPTSPHSRL
eukprot:CAMPEP_0173222884 /NCGR_PEP_ID=MMETSP1142-20121109/3489_1 /TAXON_ID=483371 /ORGANISM="non described non described, Strain CCMP2298" /LENGTH=66 /DNA_ID=CAMNT_0014151005 /DNA_START=425 /DNA_END=625 /DNA_ORIENTATION=-